MKHFDWSGFTMFLGGLFVMGMIWLGYAHRSLPPPPEPPPAPVVDFQRLDRLEVRVKAMEDKRSMNIHPTVLYISVYPVENVGRVAVTKP